MDEFTRQDEALAFLRGALSRCDQEGCGFVDVIKIVKSWADTKGIVAKPKAPRYIRLTDDSPLPEIGAKVRIEDGVVSPHELMDIGTVVHYSGAHTKGIVGVRVEGHQSDEDENLDWEYYYLRELSLVVEE